MEILNQNTPVLFLLLFVIITFLQSGLDKILDWNGNKTWLKEHFSKTPFRNTVPLLLFVITCTEMLSGLFSLAGLVQILISEDYMFARAGAIFANGSLLMLLLGQRVAKDYEGAKTLVIYFIPTFILLLLLQF
jgi:uncharacterized membrane protein YphA (DoxX/SURF4 family)